MHLSKGFLEELNSYKKTLGVGSLEKVIKKLREGALRRQRFLYGWISNPRNNVLIIKCPHCDNYYTETVHKGLKFLGSTHNMKPCPNCGTKLYNIHLTKATLLENQIETKVSKLDELPPLKGDLD